ncbi:putative MFS transporter [Ascodesmis nigricans]|uniref:Putative MFS transporter n=1 Tax=Ascodesmis nigricans TaxID=341454 RepID=A0A4S2MWV9_9PEZI|nr:putative MFS transporter [Ascodesmis nigricans]
MKDLDDATKEQVPSSHLPSEETAGIGALDEDPNYERRLVRKLDLHIIPLVMALYLFSFLDRVNIGSARLYNLEEDLGLNGNQFQLSVSILFVTYLAFEIPGNLVLKKFTPRFFISAIALAWGIVSMCTGFVQSFGGLIACRLILGAVEASLFPGLTIYLTTFYTKNEIALRIGYLFVSAALAGACGGLLAFAIGYMEGLQGMNGWRWILIIEGLPTIILGVISFFYLADDPETANYLTPEERIYAIHRLSRDVSATRSSRQFHWADVRACFTDWRCYAFAVGQFGVDTMLYGFSTFLPTIIKSIHSWSNAEVQALTIPCYAVGAITYLIIARISDAHGRRAPYIIIFAIISCIGYALLLAPVSPGVRYFACFLVALGLYVAVGLPLAWLPNNSPRYGKRTAATGMQLTMGNASGVMIPFMYDNSPRFVKGQAVSLAMVAMGAVVYGILWYEYDRINKRRDRGEEDWKAEGKADLDVREMGDDSPRYRYTT